MNIKEMHYDFKKKLNKIDSQQYKNLLVPEIDWTLNEAAEIFVKDRIKAGIENGQTSIDDVRALIKLEQNVAVTNNVAVLPDDYWHYMKSKVLCTKGSCENIQCNVFIRQIDDEFELSPFDSSSFEWRTVNAVFHDGGIKFYNSDFSIESFSLSYLRRMLYMHNAEDYRSGGYTLPGGVSLSGTQDCELGEQTHRAIVDIAVLIATGEIEAQNSYQLRQLKVNMNQEGS